MKITNTSDESAKLREALVIDIVDAGLHSLPLPIIHAFTEIPREMFVPSFFEEREGQWITVSQKNDPLYLQKVYTDTSLVVQVDHRGWPCSSSSMPSIMALMLDALDIKLGNKVLEIGTGTGYNAAMLSLLTGDPSLVTTIDCDNAKELSHVAKETLHKIVGPVNVIIGDGFQGVPDNAPYDRILATASAPTIPAPWVEQLAPGGIMVMDLHGTLESGFLVFTKNREGEGGTGRFLQRQLHFMPLVSESVSSIYVDTKFLLLLQQPHQKNFHVSEDSFIPLLLNDHALRWFLQWYITGCNIVEMNDGENHKVFIIDYKKQTILQFRKEKDGWVGDVFGDYTLWDTIKEAMNIFKMLRNPTPTDYTVEVGKNRRSTISARLFSLTLT